MKNKNRYSIFIKCNSLHRLGNVITSLVHVAENLVIILTLGFVYPKWSWNWIMYRLDTKLYQPKN